MDTIRAPATSFGRCAMEAIRRVAARIWPGTCHVCDRHGKVRALGCETRRPRRCYEIQTVWKISSKAVPRMVSPVVVGDLLFLVADIGSVTCLEIATGHQLWQHSVGGRFIALPIYADGRIYFFDLAGKGYVIKPGRTFELLAINTLIAVVWHRRSSRKGLVRADEDGGLPDRVQRSTPTGEHRNDATETLN